MMKRKNLITKILGVLLFCSNLASNDTLVVVDTSGSLDYDVAKKEISKIVDSYLKESVPIIAFNSSVYDIKTVNDLNFGGGTDLAEAYEKTLTFPFTKFVITITDGRPNNDNDTLFYAQELKKRGIKLCTIFLSNKEDTPPNVLKKFSDKIFVTNEFSKVRKLCSNQVKNKLLGLDAVKKSFNENQYNLF